MKKIAKCVGSMLLMCCCLSLSVQAATMPLADIAVGQIITVNGMKFAKTTVDGKFTAICESNSCSNIEHCTGCSTTSVNSCVLCESGYAAVEGVCVDAATTMQGWTGCDMLTTPTSTNFTQGPTLIDIRDGKSYEIRKFADGKCWMVDNLKYGGTTDACASKTSFSGSSSSTATNRFGTGTYGDCRNNPGDPSYGYLYDWQAAMQHTSAYYGNSYQPTEPTQGICPDGWHIPKGNTTGEYQALNTAVSATYAFWGPSGNWKGVYSGGSNSSGGLVNQGLYGFYWSSTQYNTYNAYNLDFNNSSGLDPALNSGNKNGGHSVRCIKDQLCAAGTYFDGNSCVACPAGCTECSGASYCTKCGEGYLSCGNGICYQDLGGPSPCAVVTP